VSATIASICLLVIDGFRPRPEAILPIPLTPSVSKRRRHRRTVSGAAEHFRAMASFAVPSAASNNAFA
jgi:hypothetical protein